MKLVGMLDSPYVRRVAISLQLQGLAFEHESVSVFRGYERFREINPVVKAPSLCCDDGTVLMDSTLILAYTQALAAAAGQRSLLPTDLPALQRTLRLTGLALAACEKSIQLHYERVLRPAERQHEPWLTRVTLQARTAFDALESDLQQRPLAVETATIDTAGIAIATAWRFTASTVADLIGDHERPALRAFSAAAEALPSFRAAPHGDATYRAPAGAAAG